MVRPVHTQIVLLVDDSENEFWLTSISCFEEFWLPVILRYASDGARALNYLAGAGRFSNRREYPYPDWILANRAMPGMSGLELLRQIRANPATAALPVVLYGMLSDEDVREAAGLGACCFRDYPSNQPEQFKKLIEPLLPKARPNCRRWQPSAKAETLKR